MNKPVIIALMLSVLFFKVDLFAQEGGEAEVQVGAGYIRDSGEGPSVGSLGIGGVFWFSRHTGLGGRFVTGIGNDHFAPPVVQDDRTFLGLGGARQSAFTVQFRGFATNGIELNFGLGYSAVSYEYQTILRIGLVDGRAVPVAPQLHRERYGVGAIRTEFLIGKSIRRGLSLKGGFIYDLTGDMHPFQPMVLLALRVG